MSVDPRSEVADGIAGSLPPAAGAYPKPPFLYEIRVKGRLAVEQWTDWFDDLTVSVKGGESTLRGSVPDHAALYGLLARLRDLAIPLVAVRVLDAEAQRKLHGQSRRLDLVINGLQAAIYLALLGVLTTITVFVAPVINPALAIALLFAALGGLAHVFWLGTGQHLWRWLGYVMWPAAGITFLVYLPVSGLLPPALGIAIILLLLAVGLLYALSYVRSRADELNSRLLARARAAGADKDVPEPAGSGNEDRG